jgi:hypothetical protein
MAESTVFINIGPLQNLRTQLDAELASGGSGPIHDALRQWAFIVRTYEQRRFIRFARGGGDWPALAPSTIAGHRHGKGGNFKRGKKALAKSKASGGGQVSILWDVGTLLTALDPVFQSAPGAVEEAIPYGIEIGYGGPAPHPGGHTTIADIAAFHDQGTGKLPQRKILADPDQSTTDKMQEVMIIAIDKATKR